MRISKEIKNQSRWFIVYTYPLSWYKTYSEKLKYQINEYDIDAVVHDIHVSIDLDKMSMKAKLLVSTWTIKINKLNKIQFNAIQ